MERSIDQLYIPTFIRTHLTEGTQSSDWFSQKQLDGGSLSAGMGKPHWMVAVWVQGWVNPIQEHLINVLNAVLNELIVHQKDDK